VVFPRLLGWVSTIVNRPTQHRRGRLDTAFSYEKAYETILTLNLTKQALSVRRIGGVAMAGKPALASPPVTQEPYRDRDCEYSRAHSFCHAKYTHVSQTLWRGLLGVKHCRRRPKLISLCSRDRQAALGFGAVDKDRGRPHGMVALRAALRASLGWFYALFSANDFGASTFHALQRYS